MKIKVTFFDLETTSENPATAEILTGFFRTLAINFKEGSYEFIDQLFVTCKPIKYLQASFGIHGISESEANAFLPKKDGLREICRYTKKNNDSLFCCHSNAYIFGRSGHFDWTVLQNDLWNISPEVFYWFRNEFRETKVISTHTIAKKLIGIDHDEGLKLKHIHRHYGFGEYKEHDAQEDVEALIRVFMRMTTGMEIYSEEDLYDLGHYSGKRHWTRNGFLI